MEPEKKHFFFYELVSGNILEEVEISTPIPMLKEELKRKSEELSAEFGLKSEDVFWVEFRKSPTQLKS